MNSHLRALAWLNIGLGSLGLLAAFVIFVILGGIGALMQWAGVDLLIPAAVLAIIATVIIGIILVLSLPMVIGGYGLLTYQPWGRVMMLVVSALNLLHPPIGTALGVYGLWVLLKPETETLFRSTAPAV